MLIVPLRAVPAQFFDIQLNGIVFTINVYTKKIYDFVTKLPSPGLYLDIASSGTTIIQGALAKTKTPAIRSQYLLANADFTFLDQSGNDDPQWTGLGNRWELIYYNVSNGIFT